MRQIAGIALGAVVAVIAAVILGEYDLTGATAIFGFPLYALAVTEVAIAVGGRLRRGLVAVAVAVGGGLTWALWISFNHFRREQPPILSWVMVVVAVALVFAWGLTGHKPKPNTSSEDPPAPSDDEPADDA